MTEPRKCPEPGWNTVEGHTGGLPVSTPEQHELAALRAWGAELEAQLDEAHKREVVLREAISWLWSDDKPCEGGCDHKVCAILQDTSESATAWLKAHDREVLEKPMALLAKVAAMMNGEDWLNFQGGLTGFKRMGITYLAQDVRAAVLEAA